MLLSISEVPVFKTAKNKPNLCFVSIPIRKRILTAIARYCHVFAPQAHGTILF